MKNFKKVLTIILVLMMASTILISCGPKTSPEDSAKILLDVILKDDKANMNKIGMKDEDYDEFKKTEETEINKELSMTGLSSNLLTEDTKTQFKNDYLKGLTTLTYEVTPVSTDKDTAKVNVKIKVFDMDKISKDSQTKIIEKVTANPNMTEQEIYKESFKLVGDAIAAGTVKEEAKTVEITLNKKNNYWLPSSTDLQKIIMTAMGE